jgi:hypothetical protein
VAPRISRTPRFIARLTAYADDAELVIPGDLEALSDEELNELATKATGHFDEVFGDGKDLPADALDALAALTEGIEALTAEQARRAQAAQERAALAADLASRVHPKEEVSEEETPAEEVEEAPAEVVVEEVPQAVAASAANRRINLPATRPSRRQLPATTPKRMTDVAMSADGVGLDWDGIGKAVDRQLGSFNEGAYAAANGAGRHLRQQNGVVTFRRTIPADLIIESSDPAHVDAVMRRAMSESRLPGGSLVASGGWCAPSETLYTMCELESRDGLLSVPEVGVSRGGINYTTGPNIAEIWTAGTGFRYTEAHDIAGTYAVGANGVGTGAAGDKPCYKIDCPPFQEVRLETNGLCLTAGLLQSRGYPEVIARVTRGALIAHDHLTSTYDINKMVAGSTPVTYPNDTVGAIAPLLTAIEQQVEHTRYVNRMARGTTLEAVFPYWVHGAVRSDLAQRLGVELLDVTDQRIDGWFRSRGISPQFVYDWQALTGAAGAFIAWPTTVQFLLYPAGTWVRGVSDVITLDTLYDSMLLGQNDYTALFTEEASLMAKMCVDSRVVTVSLCPDGSTHAGVLIDCDGSATVVP